MSDGPNGVNIPIHVSGSQEASAEIGKVAEQLSMFGEEAVAAAEETDKLAQSSANLAETNKRTRASTKDVVLGLKELNASVQEASAAQQEFQGKLVANINILAEYIGQIRNELSALIDLTLEIEKNRQAEAARAAATSEASAASEKAAKGAEEERTALEMLNATIERNVALQKATAAANIGNAETYLSTTQKRLTALSSMGTPAILKTATWGALGIGGIAYEGIKNYMSFNQQMTQLATQAGRNKAELPFLSEGAMNIAKQTGMALNDVADAMYRVASGTAGMNKGYGLSTQGLVAYTDAIAKLNILGNIPSGAQSEQSARLIAAMVNTDVRGAGKDPSKLAAILNATVGAGDIRMNELISGMGKGILTAAKANNLTAQDALSWVDLMTSMGTTGSVAGTYVRSAMSVLLNPSTQGNLALATVGIKPGDLFKLAGGKGGLASVADYLNEHIRKFGPVPNFPKFKGATGRQAAINKLQAWGINQFSPQFFKDFEGGFNAKGGSAADIARMEQEKQYIRQFLFVKSFGGARQLTPLITLLNNVGEYRGIEANINRNSTAQHFEKSVALAMDTPQQRFHKALQSLNIDLVNIGQKLYPSFIKIVNGFATFADFLTKHSKLLEGIVIGILGAIGMTLASKSAQFMLDAYAPLGRMVQFGSKRGLGRLFGSYDETGSFAPNARGMTRFGQAYLRRGQHFEEAYNIKKYGALGKAGKEAALYGEATTENVTKQGLAAKMMLDASERMEVASKVLAGGTGGGGGGGGGGGKKGKRAIKAAEEDATKAAEKDAVKAAEGDAVKAAEKGVLGDVAGVAEKAGGGLLSRVGGGLLSGGLADLAGGALGMLGGPVGMLATSVLAPLAAPYVMQGIGALGNMLGGLFGGGSKPPKPPTPNIATFKRANQYKIDGLRAKIHDVYAKAKNNLTASDIAKIQGYENQISTLQGTQSAIGKGATDSSLMYAAATSSAIGGTIQALQSSRIHGQALGRDWKTWRSGSFMPAWAQASWQQELAHTQDRGQLAKWLGNFQKTQMKTLLGTASGQAYLMGVNPSAVYQYNLATRKANQNRGIGHAENILSDLSTKNISSMTNAQRMSYILSLSRRTAGMQRDVGQDVSIASNKRLPMAVREQYAAMAESLSKEVSKTTGEIKALRQGSTLTNATIEAMAQAYAKYNSQTYTSLGMTATQLSAAIAKALQATVPAIVAGANANTGARH